MILRSAALIAATTLIGACAKDATPALPALAIDPARVTVSGLSSGAYMAQQVHLAYSDRLAGAALLAGGPYGCAGGDLERALKNCMAPPEPGPDVAGLASMVRERAAAGALAPLAGLAGDKVWVFRGAKDALVGASVTRASAALYDALAAGASVSTDFERPIAHLFPTIDRGVTCDTAAAPYIGACGFDAAGAIFSTLYGTAAPAANATGEVLRFDQQALVAEGTSAQLAATGFVYVPAACRGARCGLHIAFHGCEQNAAKIERAFVDDAGYQRWADAAGVVLVFPQTEASLMPLNPKACWDWWGYTGKDYDTRSGAQIRFVGNLLDALGVRAPG
jgi:pimeloyl-ACP methyl ester carboxylesterase